MRLTWNIILDLDNSVITSGESTVWRCLETVKLDQVKQRDHQLSGRRRPRDWHTSNVSHSITTAKSSGSEVACDNAPNAGINRGGYEGWGGWWFKRDIYHTKHHTIHPPFCLKEWQCEMFGWDLLCRFRICVIFYGAPWVEHLFKQVSFSLTDSR